MQDPYSPNVNQRIDCNTGRTVKVDSLGQRARQYHTNVTGSAGPNKRYQFASQDRYQGMVPSLPLGTMNKNVLPGLL